MLAEKLGGFTVAELRDRLSYSEFISWIAYYDLQENRAYPQTAQPTTANHTGISLADKFKQLTKRMNHD